MREEFIKAKKDLVSQLKQDCNYNYKYSRLVTILFALALITDIGLFVFVILTKTHIGVSLILLNIIYIILLIVFIFLDGKANPEYSNLRRGIADIENLLNENKEIIEPYTELYSKYKNYFDLYIKYINECRK